MIAASIVTYHTPLDELAVCLHSLCACRLIGHIDIVDNGDEQRIREFCLTYGPRVAYHSNRNTGYGAGHNLSLRDSLHNPEISYHLVINSDTYFVKGTIETLIDIMERDSSVGQATPRVIYPDGRPQCGCHPVPAPMDLIAHRFLPEKWCARRMRRYEIDATRYSRPINVPYHHGCFMLFRTSALRETGLFDERFFMYPEDIDMTRRVHARYKTLVVPSVTVTHIHHASSRTNIKMLWIHTTNMLRYFMKWGFVIDTGRAEFNRRLEAELTSARIKQ